MLEDKDKKELRLDELKDLFIEIINKNKNKNNNSMKHKHKGEGEVV